VIKSMTGFGRGEASEGPFKATVEVRSVNHRFADVKFKLPSELAGVERMLHQRLSGLVHRGRLDISVNVTRGADGAELFEINHPVVSSYLKAAEQIRIRYELPGEVGIQDVLALPDAIRSRPGAVALTRENEAALLSAFDKAISAHDAMRMEEGKILARDIGRRILGIRKSCDAIRRRAPKMVPLYARRLKGRIKDLGSAVDGGTLDPTRLAQEVALAAERSDITEELVRLDGYIEQLMDLMADTKEPVGKKLDFIMQEMNREANTINSKALDLAICRDALEVKAEVEKIREQVQNIE